MQQLENDLLVDLVLKYKVIECKATDVVSMRARIDRWKRLAEEFNSISTNFISRFCLQVIIALCFLGTPMHSMFSHYVTSSVMLYVMQSAKCV